MKKDIIVQFVCFNTNLEYEEFFVRWEAYAKKLSGKTDTMLQEMTAVKLKTKYRYVSQHKCEATDFKFAFMKGRSQDHFPEQRAKVVNAGGYISVQFHSQRSEVKNDVKVIAFLDHNESDLDFFHQQTYRHLNIYMAYYESCTYAYILEFFLQESDAEILIEKLNKRPHTEAGIYKECAVQKELALKV
jgi:hypothetical protein